MTQYYSRWLEEKELKEINGVEEIDINNSINVSGLPLKVEGNKMLIDSSLGSTMIIGASGSGKTQATVLPMLNLIRRAGESVLLCDVNGEIYNRTAYSFKNSGYKTIVLDFKNADLGDYWNPLAYPYYLYQNNQKDEAMNVITDLAHTIFHEEGTMDPFWEITSSDYFTALCLGLFQYGKEEEININSISKMLDDGDEKIALTTYAQEFFKHTSEQASICAAATINAPKETKGSILSVLRQKLRLYLARESFNQMLSKTSFNIKDVRDKHIIYLVLPENMPNVYPMVNILINQIYHALDRSDYTTRFNYILDDFELLDPIKNFGSLLTASRSRNIKFVLLCRSYRELYDKYGKEEAEKIINSTSTIVYLITDDRDTAERISLYCGDKEAEQRLVGVDELLHLNQWETVMLKIRTLPIRLSLTPNYKIDWHEEFIDTEIPTRDKVEIAVFNMKAHAIPNQSNFDELIAKIDNEIEELEKSEQEDNKTVIEKTIKKIEIEKDKVTIYYE